MQEEASIGETRKFKVSNINFDAKGYIKIITWPENDVIEPLSYNTFSWTH